MCLFGQCVIKLIMEEIVVVQRMFCKLFTVLNRIRTAGFPENVLLYIFPQCL